jgi:tRNA(adenine34) deaminase
MTSTLQASPIPGAELDDQFMEQAIGLAREAMADGEVPIGCLIVKDGLVLARGRNRMEAAQNASAHAEIEAISSASRTLDSWRLDGCTLYVTLEPCPMCAGAILLARLDRVVYGAADRRLGACDTHYGILSGNPINRQIEVLGGVRETDCATLLRDFFRELRSGARPTSRTRRLGGASASNLESP